ncbi:MAG: hypothetical protein ACRCW9_06375 [Cetobacterium sp.]
MLLSVNNRDYNMDLKTTDGQEQLKEFALTRNYNKLPFLNSLAIANTKIKSYQETQHIPLEEIRDNINTMVLENIVGYKTTENLAFTTFNPLDSFFYLYINYEKLEEDPRFNVDFVSFIYLHQVCHNYFGHFTRPVINEYRKKNKAITEMVLDAQVNTFLSIALGYEFSTNTYVKLTKKLIEEEYATYDKLYTLLQQKFQVQKDFNTKTDFPPIEKVLSDCQPLFELPQEELQTLLIQFNLGNMDEHSASEQLTQGVAIEINQSVEELNTIQASSMEFMANNAKLQGISMSELESRQIESLFTKKSVLEVIKLTKTLKQASRLKYKKTWERINRRRQYSEDIFMMGKKPCDKYHLVVSTDVSGSVSDEELKLIYSHLKTFAKDRADSVVVDVFFWSSCKIEAERDLISDIGKNKIDGFKPYSSGGTVFEYVDDFIREHYKNKKIILVNITDGYFSPVNLDPNIVEEHYAVLTVKSMTERITRDFKNKTVPVKLAVEIRNEKSAF